MLPAPSFFKVPACVKEIDIDLLSSDEESVGAPPAPPIAEPGDKEDVELDEEDDELMCLAYLQEMHDADQRAAGTSSGPSGGAVGSSSSSSASHAGTTGAASARQRPPPAPARQPPRQAGRAPPSAAPQRPRDESW
ncbi:unnamed protein product, partial [Polarella glacialis]